MALFPVFIDLSQKKILLLGAGYVAARKAENLLKFVSRIDCIATFAREEMSMWSQEGKINFTQKLFEPSDLIGYDLIIVAVDDIGIQKVVFDYCSANQLLCNSVDSPAYCNFIFPSLIKKDDFVIGLTSSGIAPGVTSYVRQKIEQSLPKDLTEIIYSARNYREELKKQGFSVSERSAKVIEFVKSQFKNLY